MTWSTPLWNCRQTPALKTVVISSFILFPHHWANSPVMWSFIGLRKYVLVAQIRVHSIFPHKNNVTLYLIILEIVLLAFISQQLLIGFCDSVWTSCHLILGVGRGCREFFLYVESKLSFKCRQSSYSLFKPVNQVKLY